ncbi:hypothetical protein CEP52_003717 [Fusarium oligoseptatum]|uniref:Fungal lipase-type domain-containing protein n=1 Tax=Fusarium oligoseptatum TaxID=2604345 RepID=A0A428U760_9HYPO|nr:hypothetical protein CEP52_003717 [Fusarium oligoseptatum]
MGWFVKTNKVKKKSKSNNSSSKNKKQKKTCLLDPPNVYGPAQQQQVPPQPQLLLPPPPNYPYSHGYASQSQPQFRPPVPPPPPAWNGYQPVIVNQHYYLGNQQQPQQQVHHHTSLSRLTGSMVNLAKDVVPFTQLYDDGMSAWHGCAQTTNAVYADVYSRFNNVMTLIDHEKLCGNEGDLFSWHPPPPPQQQQSQDKAFGKSTKRTKHKDKAHMATSVVSGNYFSKVELYANSKLPADLPPLALYLPTWQLLCLAAEYSQRVYEKPRGSELDAHVSSDWLSGTKAMCIKSKPMDHMSTIVFAIRGTATFMDWAVNLKTAPSTPAGFLDDSGNLCHAGFLSVARSMIRPVAARLRQLLREDPRRSSYNLMLTGHSAGGAVAALLYSHMLAETAEAESELNALSSCFKKIHCVTFGAPPVSLLPLAKPDHPNLRNSVFLSFINEGDPVVRADKAYVRSLLELLASPPPKKPKSSSKSRKSSRSPPPVWNVPPCTLSNAGRLVILRTGDPRAKPKDRKTVRERIDEGVVAVTCLEEQLRDVIWGDPVCHLMSLYAERIEVLAVRSIKGRG